MSPLLTFFKSHICLETAAVKPAYTSPDPKGITAERLERGRAASILGEHPTKLPDDNPETSILVLMINPPFHASSHRRVVEREDLSAPLRPAIGRLSKVLQTAEVETDRPTPRVKDSDSSAYSSALSFSPPDPYDGKPNQRAFDEWVLEVKNWVSLEKLSRKEVMHHFPRLVTGEAKRCFQKYVLPTLRSRKWKTKEVFELLQEHCLPYDQRVRFYEQLKLAKQGNRRVIVYAEEVKFLAKHLPHVSKKFLALVFWAGLNPRIRNMLIMKGIEPGRVDPETLVQRALKRDGTSLDGVRFW